MAPSSPDLVPLRLALSGPLTAATAVEQRAELLLRLGDAGDVTLALAEVTEIDAAGLQLLLSARRWAAARGRGFAVEGAPLALEERCAALGRPLDTLGHER